MIPLWIATGLFVCIALASFNTFQKSLVRNHSPLIIGFYSNAIASVLVGGILLATSQDFISFTVLPYLIASVLFNALAFYTLPKALETEDLGVIAPVRGIVPVSIAALEPLFFSGLSWSIELVGAAALAGAGLYVAFSQDGLLTPIKKMQTVGVGYAFLSAISIVGAVLVDRYAVFTVEAPVVGYGFGLISGTAVVLGISLALSDQELEMPNLSFAGAGISRGIAVGLGLLTLTLVSGTQYNILVQLSIPLSVVFGYVFLDERRFTGRQLLGSCLILLSIVIVL